MKKVAIITGASRGLGKSIAIAFGKNDYRVVVHYNKSREKALKVVHEIETNNGEAIAIQAALSNPHEIESFINEVMEKYQRIDVLINNAGVKDDYSTPEMPVNAFDYVFDVNVKGAWLMMKYAGQVMIKQKSGSVINISSGVGTYGREFQANYAGSKGAINAITKSLSKEYGPYNINVNAIAPGLIETDMTSNISDEQKAQYKSQIPLKRLGRPQDIANAALFLASEKATFISGQILHVNGGLR